MRNNTYDAVLAIPQRYCSGFNSFTATHMHMRRLYWATLKISEKSLQSSKILPSFGCGKETNFKPQGASTFDPLTRDSAHGPRW